MTDAPTCPDCNGTGRVCDLCWCSPVFCICQDQRLSTCDLCKGTGKYKTPTDRRLQTRAAVGQKVLSAATAGGQSVVRSWRRSNARPAVAPRRQATVAS